MNQRVKVTKTPPRHGTGKDSKTCTCKGKTGTVVAIERVANETIGFVKLDGKGQAGIPMNCLKKLLV